MNLFGVSAHGAVSTIWIAFALLLGLSASCTKKQRSLSDAPSGVPTRIDGVGSQPHLVTVALRNRGEGPRTAHYTYNGRDMGTYSGGLLNVVRELESAPEPYVLILHEPGLSIADAGGNIDGLNARFAQALAGKRVLQYELDTDAEVLVVYIGLTNDNRGIFELNGQRATRSDVSQALPQYRIKKGIIIAVEQGPYKWADPEETKKDVGMVCIQLEDYQYAYRMVRWVSLQDSVEWRSE